MESLLGVPWYGVCSVANLVFVCHLCLSIIYLVVAQITRLIAIKKMEEKALFRDLAEIAFRFKGNIHHKQVASYMASELASHLASYLHG